jgi:hypothetical protein
MGGKGSEASGTRIKANVIVEGVIGVACAANHGCAGEDPAEGMQKDGRYKENV